MEEDSRRSARTNSLTVTLCEDNLEGFKNNSEGLRGFKKVQEDLITRRFRRIEEGLLRGSEEVSEGFGGFIYVHPVSAERVVEQSS